MTALAAKVMRSVASVRPSVRTFPLLSFEAVAFDTDFCMRMDRGHSSTGIKSQGQRLLVYCYCKKCATRVSTAALYEYR